MKKGAFWVGILGGVVLSGIIGFLLLPLFGIFDTKATGKLNILDWWGETNLENSLRWRAPNNEIPASADTAAGFEYYRTMCLHCHGAPEASREEWAYYMLPHPPKLWENDTQEMRDGEFFTLIKDGIRMTGMPAFGPTHSDSDIWNMVAFMRQLNQLSDEQKRKLEETSRAYGH